MHPRRSIARRGKVALDPAKQTKTIAELAKLFQAHPIQIG